MESINLKEQYEKIIEKCSELLMRIKTACSKASVFVPQEFLNPVKEKLYKSMQKDYLTRLDTLKKFMESNFAEESKRQEIKIQENLLQTLEETTVSSYEKILKNFFEQLEALPRKLEALSQKLEALSRKTRKNKIKEFVEIVHPDEFVKILNIIRMVQTFFYTYQNKSNSLSELQQDITEAKELFDRYCSVIGRIKRKIQQDENFPKNLDLWEPTVNFLHQSALASPIHVLEKDCKEKTLVFNAESESGKTTEYSEFLNKSLTYTKKERGLIAVNLHQFFLNNYGSPHWLWIAELLNSLFDTQETEVSIRENLKKQLQQTIVFLSHAGLHYLKKKDEVKPS